MTVERKHNGAYYISDIVGGYRIHQTYYFYTRREAIAAFREFSRKQACTQ